MAILWAHTGAIRCIVLILQVEYICLFGSSHVTQYRFVFQGKFVCLHLFKTCLLGNEILAWCTLLALKCMGTHPFPHHPQWSFPTFVAYLVKMLQHNVMITINFTEWNPFAVVYNAVPNEYPPSRWMMEAVP